MAEVEMSQANYNVPSISQSHRDVTDEKYRDLRHPRKVRFFANGNRFFKGKKVYVTPHRYVTFNDLLNDLTSKLPHSVQLPYGVRQIFTPVGGRKVRDIEEFVDGKSYVCGGFETFKTIKYGKEALEPWSHHRKPLSHEFMQDVSNSLGAGNTALGRPGYPGMFQPGRPLRQSYPYRKPQYGTFGSRAGQGSYWGGHAARPAGAPEAAPHMKPKVITIVRNSQSQPRANVKILLNRRSVQSYDQMMKDVSEAFGPKWRNNKVRKLFSIKGKEVQGISDFFRDDEVFIGVGSEPLTTSDVQDILQELYPDSPYSKNLLKEWDKTKKRYQNAGRTKEEEFGNKEDNKIDSGLGSDASKDDDKEDNVIYKGGRKSEQGRSRKSRNREEVPMVVREEEQEDFLLRIEKERMRASEEERERARKRMQKRLEAERRILDEERRKKGLLPLRPLQDPFKKPRDSSPFESPHREKKVKPSAVESPRHKKEDLARSKAERKLEDDEPKVIVVVKGQDEGQSGKGQGHKGTKTPRSEDTESEGGRKSKLKKDRDRDMGAEGSGGKGSNERDKRDKESDKENAKTNTDKDGDRKKKQDKDNIQKESNTDLDENANKKKLESKGKENKEESPLKDKRRKSKPNVVRKSKLERQISNADHVVDKYIPGKVLGDGNFAVVKQCRLNNTNNEYAMKVIDKAKLKGKEHMIENEIEIMKVCSHPNIVTLVEEYETKSEIYLIMELVKGGDLFDAITESVKFTEVISAGMVRDLTQALFYLHSRGIVHRDLKPENLLVCRKKDSGLILKLADFGLAMEVIEPIYTVCGTPTYVAPEILSEIGYGLEVDMWAVGVITYILLCGFPPFRSPDRKQTELFEFIKAGEFEFLSPYWDNISKVAKDLISRLLVVNKKRRYTAVDTLCHPWLVTQASTVQPPADMDEHRKNMRRNLELEAVQNRAHFKQQIQQV